MSSMARCVGGADDCLVRLPWWRCDRIPVRSAGAMTTETRSTRRAVDRQDADPFHPTRNGLWPVLRRALRVTGRYLPGLTAAGCLVSFLALSLTSLDRFPVAIQDEPWILAPSIKLAMHGIYGSALFAGYYGAGRHDFQAMPAYPLLVAAVFKVIGVGPAQARMVSVLLGALTVALTYLVGRRLVGETAAALAAALLVLWRVTTYGPVFGSGVPLLDLSRIARYDVAVPPLVLLACGLLVWGLERNSGWLVAASGATVGLAALCQLYGAFWLPVLALLIIWRDGRSARRSRDLALVLAGFVVTMAPWLAYIGVHWADYMGQMRFYRPHFRFYDPGFYLANLTHEYQRYPLRLWRGYPSPGAVLFLIGVPAALNSPPSRGRAQRGRGAGGDRSRPGHAHGTVRRGG